MSQESNENSNTSYGTVLFTGVKMADADVDLYNKFTQESETTRSEEQKEFLLDQRHRHMLACAYA
jgi:hypothetical protein